MVTGDASGLSATAHPPYFGHAAHALVDEARHAVVLCIGLVKRLPYAGSKADDVSVGLEDLALKLPRIVLDGPLAGAARAKIPDDSRLGRGWKPTGFGPLAAATRLEHPPPLARRLRAAGVRQQAPTLPSRNQRESEGARQALWLRRLHAARSRAHVSTRKSPVGTRKSPGGHMTSQTRLPPISRLLIPSYGLIFLRRLSALFSRYSGTSEAGRGATGPR